MKAPPESTASFEAEALPHLDTLYRVALRFAGDHARAEDLVQDTMLKAFRAWKTYTQGTNARAWLLTILRNTFINEYRKESRQPTAVALDAVDPLAIYRAVGHTDPEGRFFDRIIDDRVWAAIDALPEDFREVIVLSDVEGMAYGDIARMVGVPLGTVKSRLFRARRQLQGALYEHAVEMGYIRAQEAR